MHIAICEDLQKDAEQLRLLLRQYCAEQQLDAEITCFSNSEALLSGYEPGKYQILFLDILMDGTNGMEAAQKIRQADWEVSIIFITVSREFAADSYLVDAAFYIVKPLDSASLDLAMQKCRHLLRQHAKSISVSEGRHTVSVRLRDILYLESQRNDCVLHTCSGEVRTRAKLSALEAALEGWPFLRCHRSFVINLQWLEDMLEEDFILQGSVRVPISRAYRAVAQQAFRQLLTSEARRNGDNYAVYC